MADRLDITADCLADIEANRRRLARDTLKEVAEILGVGEDYFGDQNGGEVAAAWQAGDRLKELRQQRKLSLAALAREAGISPAHLSEVERGQSRGSLKMWEKLARALGVPVSYFFREAAEESLGQKLKKLRQSMGLTQKELAKKIGLSPSLIAQLEIGRVQPAITTLTRLARHLGVSPCYFLTGEGLGLEWESEDAILEAVAQRTDVYSLVTQLLDLSSVELAAVSDLVKNLRAIREERAKQEAQ